MASLVRPNSRTPGRALAGSIHSPRSTLADGWIWMASMTIAEGRRNRIGGEEHFDMIHALDHIVVAAPSLEAAVADYELLLGRRADRPDAGGGAPRASIQLANARLELTSATAGDGLSALAFAVADLGKAGQLLERRALPPSRSDDGRVLRIASEVTHRVPLLLVERAPGAISPSQASGEEDATVTGLDHIVIRSPNPERAVALYAGRLGLSLRLDRSEPAWGVRLLFPLRRSRRRGGARPQGRDRRRSRSPVGTLLARVRHRQGARADAGGGDRHLRTARGPAPAHAGIHRQEPHRRRADAGDRCGSTADRPAVASAFPSIITGERSPIASGASASGEPALP